MLHSKKKNRFLSFFHELGISYVHNKTDQMAAALSFYAILSLPSLLILMISVGSLFVGQAHIKNNITAFIADSLDQKTAQSFVTIIETITASSQQTPATIVSFLVLVLTATAIFDHLIHSLHTIWKVKGDGKQPIVRMALQKVAGLFFILFIDITLVLVFLMQNMLGLAIHYIPEIQQLAPALKILQAGIGLLLPFLFLLFLSKVVARVPVSWKIAALGAIITTLLLALGNTLLGIYFRHFVDFSAFGAANTLLPILVWIYFASQILFVGSELTHLFQKVPFTRFRSTK